MHLKIMYIILKYVMPTLVKGKSIYTRKYNLEEPKDESLDKPGEAFFLYWG